MLVASRDKNRPSLHRLPRQRRQGRRGRQERPERPERPVRLVRKEKKPSKGKKEHPVLPERLERPVLPVRLVRKDQEAGIDCLILVYANQKGEGIVTFPFLCNLSDRSKTSRL